MADPPQSRSPNTTLFGTPSTTTGAVTSNTSGSAGTGEKLSFEEALDYPQFFNYLDGDTFGESYDPHSTTMFGMIRSMIQDAFLPETVSNSGPFRAICIEIVDDGTGIQQPGHIPFEPGAPEDLITRYTDIKIEPRCRIRARVPGIDSYPKPVGALSAQPTSAQMDVVRMHAVFTSDMKRPAPQVGDLVYVDWRYKPKNGPWKDPVYLGRVNDNASLSMEAIMEAIAAFLASCIGAGAAGVNSNGSPMTVPDDVTFRPSGLIKVPPEVWTKTGAYGRRAKYIYYLYEKQVNAQIYNLAGGASAAEGPAGGDPSLNKLRAYWDIDKLKTVVAYLAEWVGLGAANSWVTWGVMYGECKWRPIGILGHKPAGAMKFAADTGYGMGQYPRWIRYENTLRNHKKPPPIGVGSNMLVHGAETPHLSGQNYKHEDLLDPYVSLKSIAVSYKRLFNWAATNPQMAKAPPEGNMGQPTPEALGAWWAGPGSKKRTGADFQQACPKCARKASQIPQYGPQINTISGKYAGFSGNGLLALKADAEKIINERPIPKYKTYEKWTEEQTAAIEAEKNVGVPQEFLGSAVVPSSIGQQLPNPLATNSQGIATVPFDTRTLQTVVIQGRVAAVAEKPVGKSPKQYEVAGSWQEVGAAPEDGNTTVPPVSGQTQAPINTPTPPPPAENKPLNQTASQSNTAPNSTQPNKCPEGQIQIGTNTDGTPNCVLENSPEGQAAKLAEQKETNANAQTPSAAQPFTPDSIQALCARLGGLASGGAIIGGEANTLPPVEAGGSIDAATVSKAFEVMKQEAVAAGGTIRDGRWRRKCLQFASYLAATAGSSKISKGARNPNSSKAWSGVNGGKIISCPKIKSSDGKRFGRGMTIKELTAAHGSAGTNTLKPGWAVHVKSSWTVDRTYSPKDDFHHWITYAGNDKWVDSRGIRSAAKQDGFLRGWFRGSYMHDDYIEMRRDTFGNKSLDQIPNKDRQPKVTAIHNPY